MYTFTPPNNTSVIYLAVPNFFSDFFFKCFRRRYSTFHNLDPDFWDFFYDQNIFLNAQKDQKSNQIGVIFTIYILPIFGAKTSFWGQNGLEEYGYKVQIATFFNTNLNKNMVIFTTYLLAIFGLKTSFWRQNGSEEYGYKVQIATFSTPI